MVSDHEGDGTIQRRTVLTGMGGIGLLSLSGMPLATASTEELAELSIDAYTRDTYRAIVDAIVPETPALGDELGPDHVPGGLEVGLEEFVVYGLNNFQEIQAESITEDAWIAFDEGLLVNNVDGLINGLTWTVRNTLELVGVEDGEDVFGDFDGMDVELLGVNDQTGAARIDVTIETAGGTTVRTTENYPYAELFAIVFDLVAVEFLARKRNEDEPRVEGEFPAGGLFTRLSREDRLRCLESIIDGGILDAVDDTVGKILPTIGILKFAVMAIHGLTVIGHYSEWAGYGSTRTATPTERELEVPQGEVLGHRQAGFPGFEPGYADHRGFEVESFAENEWAHRFEDGDGTDGDGGNGGDDGTDGSNGDGTDGGNGDGSEGDGTDDGDDWDWARGWF